jgi:hypothetical protein
MIEMTSEDAMTQAPEPQFVVDASGKRVAVILPIEEYEALIREKQPATEDSGSQAPGSLYGALKHLGTLDVTTEEIDEARREMWSAWDQKGFS